MAQINAPAAQVPIEVWGIFQPSAPLPPATATDVCLEVFGDWQPCMDLRPTAAVRLEAFAYLENAAQSARISALSQELATENLVNLFQIDLSKFGAGVGYFTTDVTEGGQPLRWGGKTYYPTAVEATGFERKAGGTAARPTLRLGNVNPLITSLIIEGKDLVGCEVRRYRTFRRFLDDGLEPSVTDHFPPEIYRVERLKGRNKITAEFELASILDQEGVKLPRRQIVRDYCGFIYRRWNAAARAWDIDRHDPCPYAGAAMYDRHGTRVTDRALDVCGKHLADCKLRFGANKRLYTRAFPGVDRVR